MTNPQRMAIPALLVCVLAGCVGLPSYQPPVDAAMVDVKLSPNMRNDTMTLCVDRTCYRAHPSKGHLKVPAGKRVMLFRNFVAGGYQVTYSCHPGVSFQTRGDLAYYADFEIRADRCGFLVFRLDPTSRIGVAWEPTERLTKS